MINETKCHFLKAFKRTFPFSVPCGKCSVCRRRKQKQLSLRANLELSTHQTSAFVTLTYDPVSLPQGGNLCKSDFVKFLKRLRINAKRKHGIDVIRYFGCGEYGSKGTKRPHYHLILYGLSPYMANILANEAWKKGIVHVSEKPCTSKASKYVASYICKNVDASNYVTKFNPDACLRVPPFITKSLLFGLKAITSNSESIRNLGYIVYEGVKYGLCRWIRSKVYTSKEREGQLEKYLEENRSALVDLWHRCHDRYSVDADRRLLRSFEREYAGLLRFTKTARREAHHGNDIYSHDISICRKAISTMSQRIESRSAISLC